MSLLKRNACLLLLLFGISAPLPASVGDMVSEMEGTIRARGLDPAEIVFPDRLTEEMRAWVRERVPRSLPAPDRLRALLRALRSKDDLDLQYETGHTGTAEEVFSTGTFNCLSFTHLYVALAREVEIPVYYLQVDQIEGYRREGDLVIVSGHITAGYGPRLDREVLEFNIGPEVNYPAAERISDLEALSMFYSNRGAELLQEDRDREALHWLETAVKLEPDLSGAWVNLGVARRRVGDLDGAEAAYRQAVEVDPQSVPAYSNLASLLRMRGEDEMEAVRRLMNLLERRRNRNPFTYLSLGDSSLRAGRLLEAREFYRRALRLSQDQAETRAAMGICALAAGDIEEARKWLHKARGLDPENRRVVRLQEQLERETQAC